MGRRRKLLESGELAEKTIAFSSTDQVDAYQDIADHFMYEIFDLNPGDYVITDESNILDFADMDESDASDIWRRIESAYAIVQSDVNSGRLPKIFEAIANRRRVQ